MRRLREAGHLRARAGRGHDVTAARGARSREPETPDVADEAKWTAGPGAR